MGNRAIIRQAGKHTGVYLHWNGGRDSVEPFLEYCKLKGYRNFEDGYGIARFCQVVGNWFGGSNSIGIETDVYPNDAEGLDCGIYDVRGWEIVGRIPEDIREQNNYDRLEFLIDIDRAQPEEEQLGERFFRAKVIQRDEIKTGDHIFILDNLTGETKEYEVVGIGEDRFVNGRNALGVPYVNRFERDGDYSWNVNNYLFESEYRIASERSAE